MAVSRRKFLRQTALATAACFAIPVEAWSQVNRFPAKEISPKERAIPAPSFSHSDADALEHLTREHFEGVAGSGFRVGQTINDPNPQWMRLLSVSDLPVPAAMNPGSMAVMPKDVLPTVATNGFLLSFTGAVAASLAQGTYVFEHESLGHFGLFIVPTAPGQPSYTAVINRLMQLTPVQPGGGPNSPGVNPPSGPIGFAPPVQTPAPISVPNNGGTLLQDNQNFPERPVRTRMPE